MDGGVEADWAPSGVQSCSGISGIVDANFVCFDNSKTVNLHIDTC